MKGRFDEALDRLRTEKMDLAISLKAAEVQVLVLIQEHSLLVIQVLELIKIMEVRRIH